MAAGGLQERYVARAIANWLNDKFAQTDFGQLRSNLVHRMKNDKPKHHFRSTKESTKWKGKVTRSIHEEWGLRVEAFADEQPLECEDRCCPHGSAILIFWHDMPLRFMLIGPAKKRFAITRKRKERTTKTRGTNTAMASS